MKSRTRLLVVAVGLLSSTLLWRKRGAAKVWLTNLRELYKEPAYLFGGLKTPEDLLAYVRKHSSDVALASYSAGASDDEDAASARISHNADEPMPLASTMKIVVLAAYAREVVAGRLDPKELVPVRDWERYYLPNTDGGAHLEALEALALSTYGAAESKAPVEPAVELDKVVRAMMRESDNAATDYILDRVGDEAVNKVIRDTSLRGQDAIHPILGEELLFSNPELTDGRLEGLLSLSKDQYHRQAQQRARMYRDTRHGEVRWRSIKNLVYAYQHLTPKGTASDYARIMAEVVRGEFVSSDVSEIMRGHLQWPMEEFENREQFYALGAKGGSLPGVLTWAWYLIPKTGRFAGQPRVVALFMRGVPLSAWTQLGKTYAQTEFIFQLATDEVFSRMVREALR